MDRLQLFQIDSILGSSGKALETDNTGQCSDPDHLTLPLHSVCSIENRVEIKRRSTTANDVSRKRRIVSSTSSPSGTVRVPRCPYIAMENHAESTDDNVLQACRVGVNAKFEARNCSASARLICAHSASLPGASSGFLLTAMLPW